MNNSPLVERIQREHLFITKSIIFLIGSHGFARIQDHPGVKTVGLHMDKRLRIKIFLVDHASSTCEVWSEGKKKCLRMQHRH